MHLLQILKCWEIKIPSFSDVNSLTCDPLAGLGFVPHLLDYLCWFGLVGAFCGVIFSPTKIGSK